MPCDCVVGGGDLLLAGCGAEPVGVAAGILSFRVQHVTPTAGFTQEALKLSPSTICQTLRNHVTLSPNNDIAYTRTGTISAHVRNIWAHTEVLKHNHLTAQCTSTISAPGGDQLFTTKKHTTHTRDGTRHSSRSALLDERTAGCLQ